MKLSVGTARFAASRRKLLAIVTIGAAAGLGLAAGPAFAEPVTLNIVDVAGDLALTQDAIEAMERSTRGVVEGTKTADEADKALREIERVSNQLAELIGSISSATQELAAASSRVATAMNEILAITQMTTDGTRRTAGSADRLAALAIELKSSVAGFKLA